MIKYAFLAAMLILILAGLGAQVQAQEKEPIAYIGHGAFFDQDGKQIEPTAEFVARAQDWYRTKLLASLTEAKRTEFAQLEQKLNASVKEAEGQAHLVVQQHLLNWLVANSPETSRDDRTIGKLKALEYVLQWKLPEWAGQQNFGYGEEFKLDPQIENILKSPEFAPGGMQAETVTANTGQAYINECSAAGVPIPPPIGQLDPAGTAGWKSQGFIPGTQQFIVGTPAEVRTYQSSSPAGMCIALPRYSNSTLSTVALDGVICLGQVSSKVCFWDNQMSGATFAFPSGTQIPIGVPNPAINPAGQYQAGGAELSAGAGGICTDCHAGQNPYIIHPEVDLGGGLLMGQLRATLPTFSAARYDPLVKSPWAQNQLSQSPAFVPGACSGCHVAGGSGGAFPHLSTDIPGYCGTILTQAINRTMPPGSPGSLANDPGVIALKNWCNVAASAGPSNRGDPHLSTTNDINYDFQASGEFTALRNSATNFELQTRQTPVSTTFIPDPNPYTGLQSCVSLNTAVAVRVGKHRVTYQPSGGKYISAEQLQLRIDGRPVSLVRDGFNLGGGNTITRADLNGGLDIRLADGTHLIITPNYWTSQGYWYLNVDVVNTPAREGTMGYIPPGDWLPLAPDGSSFGPAPASLLDRHFLLNVKFADAWRVTDTTSLFDYAPGTSTDYYTDRDWPPEPGGSCLVRRPIAPVIQPMSPERAKYLCRSVEDKAASQNCVFDVTTTGDPGQVKAYLRSLSLQKNAAIGTP